MIATRHQLNAIGAFLVQHEIAPIERAGALALEMLTATGYDVSRLESERVDRRTPVLYTIRDDDEGGPP